VGINFPRELNQKRKTVKNKTTSGSRKEKEIGKKWAKRIPATKKVENFTTAKLTNFMLQILSKT